jgi:hypothetical protein
MINGAILVCLDCYFNYDLFYPFSKESNLYTLLSWIYQFNMIIIKIYILINLDKLKFHDTIYFQLITMTTLGYGDMFPINIYSRIICVFYILYFTYVFTQFVNIIIVA